MAKAKATCRVAMLGEVRGFLMLPRCVVESDAYRDLSVYARAVLIEIGARFNGFNNGAIGIDQRSMVKALHCSPKVVVRALADLMEHGLIDVSAEGSRAARRAREYRLTFISTPHSAATNDYLRWLPQTPCDRKSGASPAVAAGVSSASPAVASPLHAASPAVARIKASRRKTAISENASASPAVAHICKPCPPAPQDERKGDSSLFPDPLLPGGPKPTARQALGLGEAGDTRDCQRCGSGFTLDRADRAYPRLYCSTACRKGDERDRERNKRRAEAGKPPTDSFAHLKRGAA